MRKVTCLFMLLILLSLTWTAKAQLSLYTFESAVGTFTEITGGTLLGAENTDDQRFVDPAVPLGGTVLTGVGFPIGFDFTFDGVVFDRVAINANGWISLGQSALTPSVNINSTSGYTPLQSTLAIAPDILVSRIAGMARDLQAQVGATLRIETIGEAPNRVLVVQWKNYKRFGTTGTGDSYTFQIRLYETTNKVAIAYGNVVNNATATIVQVGLRGAPSNVATNFINRTSTDSWTATSAGAAATATLALSATVFPPNGLTYTFAPLAAGAPEDPSNPSPANMAVNVPYDGQLTWTFGENTDTYDLMFGPAGNMVKVVDNAVAGATGSYSYSGLANFTTYTWQVIVKNDVATIQGPVWSFKTMLTGGFVSVYTAGDIPTDYQATWVGPSTCPGVMTVNVPAGQWITGMEVFYSMTAQNVAYMSEQRSKIYSPTLGAGEAQYFEGQGATGGTYNYHRTGLTFANGAQGEVVFHMDAGRTWGSTPPNDGCGTFYNKVDNGTWTMVIYTGEANYATISGYVTELVRGPIEGALITAGSYSATSDANGFYELLEVFPGIYNVTVAAEGYIGQTVQGVEALPGVTTTVNFQLGAPSIAVTPASLYQELEYGQTATQMLTISNPTGTAPLTWAATINYLASGKGKTYDLPVGSDRSNPINHTLPANQNIQPEASLPARSSFSEGFDDITTLPGSGWAIINRSEPVGTLSWFQGNPDVFPAHQGAPTSYAAVNFNSGAGVATLSNWLITPAITFENGHTVSFWTRTAAASTWPDRLEVRMSTAGASTDVGATATSVGVFTNLLLSVNANLTVGGYPEVWTQYTVEISGLAGPTSGRLAFRYFVTDGGPSGNNSNFIGIDSFEYIGSGGPIVGGWLSLGQAGGVVEPGGEQMVEVTFDPSEITETGTYNAEINVTHNGQADPVVVPATLVLTSIPYATVQGYVLRAVAESTPIQGAHVFAGDYEAFTDATGFFQILDVFPGTYNFTCEADGFFTEVKQNVVVAPSATVNLTFEMGYAELAVNPASLSITLEPDDTATQILTISNPGGTEALTWSADIEFFSRGRDTQIFDPMNKSNNKVSTAPAEVSGSTSVQTLEPSRDIFDLLDWFPLSQTTGHTQYSIVTDGSFIYSGAWNTNNYAKYTMDGTYISSFAIAGAGSTRDLTYDGQYFYGSNVSANIFQMDFNTQTLISTIVATGNTIRSIAYDSDNDGFWVAASNFTGPFRLISRTGTLVQTVTPSFGNISGLAYDNVSPDGPYLWAYTPASSTGAHVINQVSIATGATVQTFNIASFGIFNTTGTSGGMNITDLVVPGKWTFFGVSQNELAWVVELADSTTPWLSISPKSGTIPAGGSLEIEVAYNAEGLTDTTYYANINITHNGQVAGRSALSVPVAMTVASLTAPGVATLVSPANNATLVPLQPTFTWINGPRTAFNRVAITTGNPPFQTTVYTSPWFLGESFDLSTTNFVLDPKKVYDWEVRSRNAAGTISSAKWKFTTIGLGTIQGTVTDAFSGQPLQGVTITAEELRYSTETGANGTYFIPGVLEGTYEVTASFPFYVEQTKQTVVVHNQNSIVNFALNLFLAPPLGLQATVQNVYDVHLAWIEPGTGFPPAWLTYSGEVITNSIGAGATAFDVAARFLPDQLSGYPGGSLTKIMFVPGEPITNSSYTLKIWQGTTPPTLIYSQPVTSVIDDVWNEVVLNNPVPFNNNQELWFGFNVTPVVAGFPAGCDAGPHVEGFGNMIFFNGAWTTLFQLAPTLTFNWAVKGYVESVKGGGVLSPVEDIPVAITHGETPSARPDKIDPPAVHIANTDNSKALLGYKVYRDGSLLGMVTVNEFFDLGLAAGVYSYEVTAVYDEGESEPAGPKTVSILAPPTLITAVQDGDVINLEWVSNFVGKGHTGASEFMSTSNVDEGLANTAKEKARYIRSLNQVKNPERLVTNTCETATVAALGLNTAPEAPYWFTFTPATNGLLTISSCMEDQDVDTRLYVYDACEGNQVAYNDDLFAACSYEPYASAVTFVATAGVSYKIFWDDYWDDRGFDFMVTLEDLCVVQCPTGAIIETELCGEDTNGGCNATPNAFDPIVIGDVICGTAWAAGGSRDTDWYQLVLDSPKTLTWTVTAEFPVYAFIIDGNSGCATSAIIGTIGQADPCVPAVASALVTPGTYWLWVGNQFFEGYPCGAQNNYVAELTAEDAFLPFFTVYRNGSAYADVYDTEYVDENIVPGMTYCYTVTEAVAAGVATGHSNELCVAIPLYGELAVNPASLFEVHAPAPDLTTQTIMVTNTGTGVMEFGIEVELLEGGGGEMNEWTVNVQGTSWGDEVTWTLKNSLGTVILSGGPYGLGYNDTQTVMTADEPLEFYIEAMGEYDDNTPAYTVSCSGNVVVSGALLGGDEATYSGLTCAGDGGRTSGLCVTGVFSTGCSDNDGAILYHFANVSVPQILCSGTTPPWYKDFTDMVHILEPGQTYDLTIASGFSSNHFTMWIDWNNDLVLTADEIIGSGSLVVSNTPVVFPLTIPANAPSGTFVLRIITNYGSIPLNPCGPYSWGNVLDFTATTSSSWLSVEPAMGMLNPGESMPVEVTFNSAGLEYGSYFANLKFSTNNPFAGQPEAVVPVELLVSPPMQEVLLPMGWSGWSSYIDPMMDASFADVIEPAIDNMIITQYFTELFYPAYGINTMSDFSNNHGYVTKMAEQYILSIEGMMADPTVGLNAGWNLFPVLAPCNLSAAEVFGGITGFIIAYEVAGSGIYYPEWDIFTLTTLVPGKAYWVKTASASSYTFPACAKGAESSYIAPLRHANTTPWNEVSYTGISHIVAFDANASTGFVTGDVIGAFTNDGTCAGLTIFDGTAASLALFGNDFTTAANDGFAEGEQLNFKLYRHANQTEYILDVTYSTKAPNYDGTFAASGISVISDMTMTATGIGSQELSGLSIYPNPSQGLFNVSLDNLSKNISYVVTDAKGQAITQGRLAESQVIDLTSQPKGIYFIRFTGDNVLRIEKLVIR